MASIYHNLRTERQYKAATGLTKEQFEKLLIEFSELYIPKTANPYISHAEPLFQDKAEALFFLLHYLKAYPTLENMGLYFGISQASAYQYLAWLMPLLKQCLRRQLPIQDILFKDPNALEAAFAPFEEIILDVTEIPVDRPKNNEKQKKSYSGKKKGILVKPS